MNSFRSLNFLNNSRSSIARCVVSLILTSPNASAELPPSSNQLDPTETIGETTPKMILAPLSEPIDLTLVTPQTGSRLLSSPETLAVGAVSGATSYRLTLTRDIDGEALELTSPTPQFSPPNPIKGGFSYHWQVDATTPEGIVEGPVQRFEVSFTQGQRLTPTSLTYASNNELLAQSGISSSVYQVESAFEATADPLTEKTTFDSVSFLNGSQEEGPGVLAGGKAFFPTKDGVWVFLRSLNGFFERQPDLTSTQGHPGLQFGTSLAAADNTLFVGSSDNQAGAASVEVFRTTPNIVHQQTLQLPPIEDDVIARISTLEMAASGDTLAIYGTNQVPGISATIRAALFIYERNVQNGRWEHVKTIVKGFTRRATGVLATDGQTILWSGDFTGGNSTAVKVVELNPESDWEITQTIEPEFSSSLRFGAYLAIEGDTFIFSDRRTSQQETTFPIYRKNGGLWIKQTTINTPTRDQFGFVNISGLSQVKGHLVGSFSDALVVYKDVFFPASRPDFLTAPHFQVIPGAAISEIIELTPASSTLTLEQGFSGLSLSSLGGGRYRLEGVAPSDSTPVTVRLRAVSEQGLVTNQVYDFEYLDPEVQLSAAITSNRNSLFEGDTLQLSANVTGVRPYSYQWTYNGEPILGANGDFLSIGGVTSRMSGDYGLEVTNAISLSSSNTVAISVQEATQYGGQWHMTGADAGHRSFLPATLGTHEFEKLWQKNNDGFGDASIVGGIVYVVDTGENRDRLVALDLTNGNQEWSFTRPGNWIITTPAVDDSQVYIGTSPNFGNSGSNISQAIALNRQTGSVNWRQNTADNARFKDGGNEGATFGGNRVWFPTSSSPNGILNWRLNGASPSEKIEIFHGNHEVTPSLLVDRAFSFSSARPVELSQTTSEKSPIFLDPPLRFTDSASLIAIEGNLAYLYTGRGDLYCFDLLTQQTLWTRSAKVIEADDPTLRDIAPGNFSGDIAVSHNRIMIRNGGILESFDPRTGESLPDIFFPFSTRHYSAPILLNDVVILSNVIGTFIISLESGEIINTLPERGSLSYAEGHIIISSKDAVTKNQQLTVYRVNDVPDITSTELPQATEDSPYQFQVQVRHHDDDETLSYSIVSGPSWLQIDESGLITGTPLHEQGGEFMVTVQVTDGVSSPRMKSLPITVEEVNDFVVIKPLSVTIDEDSPTMRFDLRDYVSDEETPFDELDHFIFSEAPAPLEVPKPIRHEYDEGILTITPDFDFNGSASLTIGFNDDEQAGGRQRSLVIPIMVNPVNDQPRLAGQFPDITASPAATPEDRDISTHFVEVDDGDILNFTITQNLDPRITSLLEIDPITGILSTSFSPYLSGSSEVTVRATDLAGLFAEQSFTIILPELPLPEIALASGGRGGLGSEIALNRQTGLYEQKVTFTNTAARAIGGFTVTVGGLIDDFVLYNNEGNVLAHRIPVGAGETVSFTLEYFSKTSRKIPTPQLTLELAFPETPDAPIVSSVEVDRVIVMEDQSILLEFDSIPGGRYVIQYTHDMLNWFTSPTVVTATANRTQWFDQGLPRTNCHPSTCKMRAYRLLTLPAAE